jgi:hypothetical protein
LARYVSPFVLNSGLFAFPLSELSSKDRAFLI